MDKLNLNTLRAQKARLSAYVGKVGFEIAVVLVWLFGAGSVYMFIKNGMNNHAGFGLLALTLLIFALAIWDKWDLQKFPVNKSRKSLDEILETKLLASFKKGIKITPQSAWQTATKQWQTIFLCNHLLFDAGAIAQLLSDNETDMTVVWQTAQDLMHRANAQQLHGGTLAAALVISSPAVMDYVAKQDLKLQDVIEVYYWLERLNLFLNQPKPYFGGFGRDWATGFTPTLDRFGQNISRQVELGHGHFHTLAHADIVNSVIHNLDSGSVGLVGAAGAGKSSVVYALAERLLRGNDPSLKYYQIISLNASAILSEAKDSLERVILALFTEAVDAQNIIIFLDDAELFFNEGTGQFNLSQILLPLLQNRKIKIIAALTPDEFQKLKNTNAELTAHLPTVVVNEPDQPTTMAILEDSALTLEGQNQIVVSFQAVKEAYRLSAQYLQDLAYPGKAIGILEQALPYANDKLMTAGSVQQAIEKTRGVKVAQAQGPEADVLLRLEELIHTRMVNQERAVSGVASALRRGRAGVGNPNRPIGSFLFLGPTGVGKTELARSLAAIYFGDVRNMVRLDMSEYQQASDTNRLIDTGNTDNKSLVLQIREQPFCVVLLDEVEKAHTNILNLLLQVLDEGQLNDTAGHATSFKNAIIITTSNAGAVEITQRVGQGDKLEAFEKPLIQELIAGGNFKPELINRFDEIVLFRPLDMPELTQVAKLMLGEVNQTLANQNISVQLTDAALQKVVAAGYDPQFGARPMRRALQKMVEDAVAKKVLTGEAKPGSNITLDVADLSA